MRPWIAFVFVLGLWFVAAGVARAQAQGAATAQGAVTQSTQYNFEDDIVSGDLVRPDGALARVRRRGRQTSLIRVREHFVPEMLKSVENL